LKSIESVFGPHSGTPRGNSITVQQIMLSLP
jgi:hypothetical protein